MRARARARKRERERVPQIKTQLEDALQTKFGHYRKKISFSTVYVGSDDSDLHHERKVETHFSELPDL